MKCGKYNRPRKAHVVNKAKQDNNENSTLAKSNDLLRMKTIRLSDGHRQRYERMDTVTPHGFQALLDKILRAVLNARPLHVLMFVAEYLEAEISRRTFDDMCYGCQLKKSLRDPLYPSESCKCLGIMPPPEEREDGKSAEDDSPVGGIDAFTTGLIKERHLCAPALDRYKQLSGLGSFHALIDATETVASGGDRQSVASTEQHHAGSTGYRLPNCTCAFCAMQTQSPGKASVLLQKLSVVELSQARRATGTGSEKCQRGGNASSVLYDVFTEALVANPNELTGAHFTVHDEGDVIPGEPSFTNERLFAEQAANSFGLAPDGQSDAFDDRSGPQYLLDEKQFMERFVDADELIGDLIDRSLIRGDPAAQDTSVSYGMLSTIEMSGSCDEMGRGGGENGGFSGGSAGDDGTVPSTQLSQPFTVFGDQPLYAEPPSKMKVFENVTMKAEEPFGSTFQNHVPFDDAFQPDYPLGEKTFMETTDASFMDAILPVE